MARHATKGELTQFPVEHLDLAKAKSVRELVEGMRRTSFQSRTLAMCASVYENMAQDPDCTILLGVAGALVAGGMRKVIRDLVESGFVDVIVTTGAIAYHDWYEAHGHRHYMSSPDADDILLRKHFLDRVYDTYSFNVLPWLGRVVARGLPTPNDGVVTVAETALAAACDRIVLPVSHSGMLFSRRVARQSGAFLRDGKFDTLRA